MIVVRDVGALRAALAQAPRPVGLVPTMGALHNGHLELLRHAREDTSTVVLSIFVNPAQFNDPKDLAAYPRSEATDLTLARATGVDIVFVPTPAEVYPVGFATAVTVSGPLTESLEGARRGPGHFSGVATVVTKLFGMSGADTAYFGEKDAQQLRVVRVLVRDLNLPVEIVGVATVRDVDGLALSSRNIRLSPSDRERSVAISRGLLDAQRRCRAGERSAAELIATAATSLAEAGIVAEYLAVVDDETFLPVLTVDRPAVLAVAAAVGVVRLIDNVALAPVGG